MGTIVTMSMRKVFALVATLALTSVAIPTGTAAGSGDRARPGTAVVVRDTYGVPHVFARDVHALFYGMGYAQGQDRLWQAELLRRAATGTLAELVGPSAVGGDIGARTLFGPRARRDALVAGASPELRRILHSYAAGMTGWIETATATGRLPVEFTAAGLVSRPWQVDDTVAVWMMLARQFGWFGADELANLAQWDAFRHRHGEAAAAAIFADTHWVDDPDAPTTVPAAGQATVVGDMASGPAGQADGALGLVDEVSAGFAALQEQLRRVGLGTGPASNAVAIGPRLSADGAPLLLAGPQFGYSAPQVSHEMGLHGAGFEVTGISVAGLPLVPIGVSRQHAWTMTSGVTDNTDLYLETLDGAGRFLFRGVWHDLDCRPETVVVAGQAPVRQNLCATIHGPLLTRSAGAGVSLRAATAGEELTTFESWINLGRARTIDEFAAQLPRFAYNFNVTYADRSGNIAYWHAGHIPVRPAGTNPFFPLIGTGEQEWRGIIPFAAMPHLRNPAQGFLANWNNKPVAGWRSSATAFVWGGAQRIDALTRALRGIAPGTVTVETIQRVNRAAGWTTDTPTGSARVWVASALDRLLGAVEVGADPRLSAVVAAMAGWDRLQGDGDGDGRYDQPWGTVFTAWWSALTARVFDDEVGGIVGVDVVAQLTDRLLRADTAGLPLRHDYLDGQTRQRAVTGALIAALDRLEARFGTADPAGWLEPVATIKWTPIGAGSVSDTVWMNRGTYNQITHLGHRVSGVNVVAPGQSGDPASPHFTDQLELYATWHYKQMRLNPRDLLGHIESIDVLVTH